VPSLVIHGEEDLIPADIARETSELLSSASLALLPRCGHLPFWEAPDRFFDLAQSFLD
jgi:pimeloyl-ACP methyl ester carboxylesterase